MVLGGCRKDPQRLELACKPMQGLSRQAAVNGLQPQWQRPHASTVLPSCAILCHPKIYSEGVHPRGQSRTWKDLTGAMHGSETLSFTGLPMLVF